MLRTRSSVGPLIDSRINAPSIAELDGQAPSLRRICAAGTADLCSAWTAGGGCPYVSISALANQLGTVSIRENQL